MDLVKQGTALQPPLELLAEVLSLVQAADEERELHLRMSLAYRDMISGASVDPRIRRWFSTLPYDWKLPSLRSGRSVEHHNTGTDSGYGPPAGVGSVLEMTDQPPAAYVKLGVGPSLR